DLGKDAASNTIAHFALDGRDHRQSALQGRFAPDRDHPNAPRYGNQSRYLAGLVSGIATQSKAVAITEAAARIKKPSQLPSASKRSRLRWYWSKRRWRSGCRVPRALVGRFNQFERI